MCAVRDGITRYLMYHNVTRILGWEEEQDDIQDLGGHYNENRGRLVR